MEHPLTAVYDANILYPAPLRDLFTRLAQAGLVRARWTETIHDEWTRNVLEDKPRTSAERIARTRTLMNDAVPDGIVSGYEDLIDSLTLPDPDDRHVLAAAIRGGAEVIVTFNLEDFSRGRPGTVRHQSRSPGRRSRVSLRAGTGVSLHRRQTPTGIAPQPTQDRRELLGYIRDPGTDAVRPPSPGVRRTPLKWNDRPPHLLRQPPQRSGNRG